MLSSLTCVSTVEIREISADAANLRTSQFLKRNSTGTHLGWQESGVDMAWDCTGFGPLCGAMFRSGAAAAF
ncbi:MAG: hypothetical protein KDA89_03575, partial [Planctomycetaceae bacterium]|nr:hypothetical protein [Planctomycetaceae bacterium]